MGGHMSRPSDYRKEATANAKPLSELAQIARRKYAYIPYSSDDYIADKGYEIWLEEGKPSEMRCRLCEERTGWDAVGHPKGRHLSQAFTR